MATEMSSQPHLLICCYLLSSRQYSVHRHTQCRSQHNVHHTDIKTLNAYCHWSTAIAWTGGFTELPISPQALVHISEIRKLWEGAKAWLPANGRGSQNKGTERPMVRATFLSSGHNGTLVPSTAYRKPYNSCREDCGSIQPTIGTPSMGSQHEWGCWSGALWGCVLCFWVSQQQHGHLWKLGGRSQVGKGLYLTGL